MTTYPITACVFDAVRGVIHPLLRFDLDGTAEDTGGDGRCPRARSRNGSRSGGRRRQPVEISLEIRDGRRTWHAALKERTISSHSTNALTTGTSALILTSLQLPTWNTSPPISSKILRLDRRRPVNTVRSHHSLDVDLLVQDAEHLRGIHYVLHDHRDHDLASFVLDEEVKDHAVLELFDV